MGQRIAYRSGHPRGFWPSHCLAKPHIRLVVAVWMAAWTITGSAEPPNQISDQRHNPSSNLPDELPERTSSPESTPSEEQAKQKIRRALSGEAANQDGTMLDDVIDVIQQRGSILEGSPLETLLETDQMLSETDQMLSEPEQAPWQPEQANEPLVRNAGPPLHDAGSPRSNPRDTLATDPYQWHTDPESSGRTFSPATRTSPRMTVFPVSPTGGTVDRRRDFRLAERMLSLSNELEERGEGTQDPSQTALIQDLRQAALRMLLLHQNPVDAR